MKIYLNKGSATLLVVTLVVATFAFGFCMTQIAISGETLTAETSSASSATVTKQVAISRSTNLTAGVLFGSVDPNTNNNNATGNWNATNFLTRYWISVDSTTNTGIMLCVKEDADLGLIDGSANISNTNYHWSAATSSSAGTPTTPASTDISTSYANMTGTTSVTGGGTVSMRFNLNVPAGQGAGSYTNNVYLKGADFSTTC